MKSVITRVSLDITKSGSQVSIPMFRGDTKRVLVFSLTENGNPYDLQDCSVDFTGKKSDGNFLNNTCVVDVEKQVVLYNLDEDNGNGDNHRQTTTCEGKVECQLIVYKNEIVDGENVSHRVASPYFDIIVMKPVYNEEDIADSEMALGALAQFYVPVSRKIANIDLKDNITVKEMQNSLLVGQAFKINTETPLIKAPDDYAKINDIAIYEPNKKAFLCYGKGKHSTEADTWVYYWVELTRSETVDLADYVKNSLTIAGVDLLDNITANEMQGALGVYPLAFGSSAVRPYSEKVGQLEYVGSGLAGNKKGLYVLLYKSDSDEVRVKLVTSDELSDYVKTDRTIAGLDLSQNISASELLQALNICPKVGTIEPPEYATKNYAIEGTLFLKVIGPKLYILKHKEVNLESVSTNDEYRYFWHEIVLDQQISDYVKNTRTIAGLDLVDDIATEQLYSALGLSQWAKEKKPSTYGQPRSLSMLDYFGANKKVVFVGDSFTQGFGSSECVSYSVTDDEGNNFNIVGNGAEYGTLNNLTDYEIGKKLWSLGSRIWYEAIDGNGYAHRLINYLKNKFGCTAKNYGMSGITTGHLLSQNMNAENSDLVTGGGAETETVILCGTQSDWVVGGINTDGSFSDTATNALRTINYIDLSSYTDTDTVVVSTSGTKFKVYYYDENEQYTERATGWRSDPLTLDKTIGSKVIVTVGTGDITKYSDITITAETVTENESGNIRVIEGLTNGFDTVFLTIGGNDRGFADYTTSGGEVITAERQFETNLTNLVKYLVNTANKKVILMSMTPCADDDTMRMSMEVIDGIIEEVATEYNLPFVSCYNGMLDYCEKIGISKDTFFDTMVTDGLHPNNEGYAVVETIICEALGINEVDKNYVDKALFEFKISDEDKQDIANMVMQMINAQSGGESGGE